MGCHIPAFPSYLPFLGFALQGPHHGHINILKGSGEAEGWQGCTGPDTPPASNSNGSLPLPMAMQRGCSTARVGQNYPITAGEKLNLGTCIGLLLTTSSSVRS